MRSVRASRSLTNRQVKFSVRHFQSDRRDKGFRGNLNRKEEETSNARSAHKRVTMASKNEEEEEEQEERKKEEEHEVYTLGK